jgi:hypothetical protein
LEHRSREDSYFAGVERLLHFLNALDRDVGIVIRKRPRSRETARIAVMEDQLSAV